MQEYYMITLRNNNRQLSHLGSAKIQYSIFMHSSISCRNPSYEMSINCFFNFWIISIFIPIKLQILISFLTKKLLDFKSLAKNLLDFK